MNRKPTYYDVLVGWVPKKPIIKAIFYKDLYITIYGMNGTPWYNSEKMNNKHKKSVTKK